VENMQKFFRPAAIIVLLFALSPIALLYFFNLPATSIWCWAWLILFAWFAFSSADLETRGMGLIVGSVFIAIIGKSYLKSKESDDLLEAISQVFLVTGGGVGGNFLAHAMLKKIESDKSRGSR
jgi:hypothetical protein